MIYDLEIGGLLRHLPIVPINDTLAIASFVILGDCELVTTVAPLLAAKLPEVDYLVTAEAKGIPLVHELCRLLGMPYYIVARKTIKTYMQNPLSSTVVSITTQKPQTLCLDSADARLLKDKRVGIVDDVISTGESLRVLEELLGRCGAHVVAKAAILAEDKAAARDDIIFLAKLPLFSAVTGECLG
jgi:adenine phosphoribosyltransferase